MVSEKTKRQENMKNIVNRDLKNISLKIFLV